MVNTKREFGLQIYAIGDVQGQRAALEELLARINLEAGDRLWFVGDLVNRGPDSLGVLRLVKALGERADVVLGNHDLHLLARAEGLSSAKQRDTLDDILNAPDRDELLTWLRHRPLAHYDKGYLMVHAGVLPEWDAPRVIDLAAEVESALQGDDYRAFLAQLYGNEPARWNENLRGVARLRLIVNALTRMRMLYDDGTMDFEFKAHPDEAPGGLAPWFELPRKTADCTIVFGHWSALGLVTRANLLALDSGCVWGRTLSAVRLSDRALFTVRCPRPA